MLSVQGSVHPTGVIVPSMTLAPLQARLLELYRRNLQLRQSREARQLVLAINRSDYMMDEPSNSLLQV